MQLRPYQQLLKDLIYGAWGLCLRVLAVLPTGGGKTVLFSDVIREHTGPACAIAHRKELVIQISIAMGRDKIRHKIIGPDKLVRLLNKVHTEEFGHSYIHPGAATAVASVDTLVSWAKNKGPKGDAIRRWALTVTLWVMDEAHHIQKNNKWGRAVALFPNAKGLGVTATACRGDGRGLGDHNDGVFERMVEGPKQRELINSTPHYLSDYIIYAPPNDLDMSAVPTAKNGDWSAPGTKKAVRKSRIIGDVVQSYLKFAAGKRGVTFATDVETATDIARAYNLAGVPAAVVSANTSDEERVDVLKKFKRGVFLQLVNVDLFGEGFDLPSIEVVSLARPTKSFGVFVQQCGRALRIMDGKTHAIIIDHVGNVARHAKVVDENGQAVIDLCCAEWSLEPQEKRTRVAPEDAIPIRRCTNPECFRDYPAIKAACPYCGIKPEPAGRSKPEFVDGDLTELSAEGLMALQREVDKVDQTPAEYLASSGAGHLPHHIAMAAAKRHNERQAAVTALRESIGWWAAYQRAEGHPDSESYRRFYFMFGLDVKSAQFQKKKEAEAMKIVIDEYVSTRYKN